ncbi:MAG: subtype I-C CRISPR-associated endonuclease Cas1 [Acidobacteria bacterium]|nr:MAG: subtype I-C CRISPR-associated endonuclease Cas1 [Acidobacteriota bacterium]
MRKFFNTLYVTTQGCYLAKERETVAVHLDDDTKQRFPFHNLDGLVCMGNIRLSPYLIGACGKKGITISYLSEHGQFLGRFTGSVSGNVLLRRRQFRYADHPAKKAAIARSIVTGKILNANTVLKRFPRDNPDNQAVPEIRSVIEKLKRITDKISRVQDLDMIRGMEGEAASLYFSVFDHLILSDSKEMTFTGRNRRPPLDPVNAMLSFAYTLLHHDVVSACESVGLDPAVGFLHTDRPGRHSLALDLMEEFRSFFADRLVLSMINRQQIGPKDFIFHSSGAVMFKDKARKTFIQTYQERKKDALTHPFLNEKMPIGTVFFYQALLLARFIRGDLDGYPPFIWR